METKISAPIKTLALNTIPRVSHRQWLPSFSHLLQNEPWAERSQRCCQSSADLQCLSQLAGKYMLLPECETVSVFLVVVPDETEQQKTPQWYRGSIRKFVGIGSSFLYNAFHADSILLLSLASPLKHVYQHVMF